MAVATASAQQTPAEQAPQPARCNFSSDRASADIDSRRWAGRCSSPATSSSGVRRAASSSAATAPSSDPDGDHVIGHAVYDEPRFHVYADFLNYLSHDERVIAVGNVNAKLPSGSTLVGPIAEYRRITPTRPHEQVLARSRPTITIVEKDSAGKPAPPMTVVGETVFMDGDSLIYAGGQVVITRPDITATADSVFLDQGKETMRLMREPTSRGKEGAAVHAHGRSHRSLLEEQEAPARHRALERDGGERFDEARVGHDRPARVERPARSRVRVGTKSLARATSPSQDMLADSIDVTMPGQKVRLMRALGRAFAQGKPDTVRFRVEKPDTTDWLRGDTITAHFDTLATKDTSKTPNIRQLFALGAREVVVPPAAERHGRTAAGDQRGEREANHDRLRQAEGRDRDRDRLRRRRIHRAARRHDDGTNAPTRAQDGAEARPTRAKTPPKTPPKPPPELPARR